MAGMLEIERSRTRRERTFIGSECAVCEEPLEHTLRGERILQFSCGHVSHEACFYEYIKEFESQYCPTCNAPLGLDTSRGGNVLDLGNATINRSQTSPLLTNVQRNLAASFALCHKTIKPGTIINAMVAEQAAAPELSPQYPGIPRQDRRDQAAADQIIAMHSVKAHSRKIHDSWSGKRKDRIGTYKGRELKDTGAKIGLHSITGLKVRTRAVSTLLANTAILTTTITTPAGGTITTSNQWKQHSAAPEQASPKTQYLRLQ